MENIREIKSDESSENGNLIKRDEVQGNILAVGFMEQKLPPIILTQSNVLVLLFAVENGMHEIKTIDKNCSPLRKGIKCH